MKKLTSVLIAAVALVFVGCASHHAGTHQPTQTACAVSTSQTTGWSALPPAVQP